MDCYFFGTFNPIHLGHIKIAKQVIEKGGFDKVIFVPSYMPPHKIGSLLGFNHRYNMTALAVKDVLDIESKLSAPSYTYRTIEKLYSENNNQKINFIIGYDQFFSLENWKEPEILKQKINFIVIPRRFLNGQAITDKAFDYFKNKGYSFRVLDIDFLDISSSSIRKNVKENKSIENLVTNEVKKYIEDNRLYK